MIEDERTLEDVGHFYGEVSPYTCDHCTGAMTYVGVGIDFLGTGPRYGFYICCSQCGAGDIGEHLDWVGE